MTAPSPGPARDRAELAEREVRHSIENREWIVHDDAKALLAEVDHLRKVAETASWFARRWRPIMRPGMREELDVLVRVLRGEEGR